MMRFLTICPLLLGRLSAFVPLGSDVGHEWITPPANLEPTRTFRRRSGKEAGLHSSARCIWLITLLTASCASGGDGSVLAGEPIPIARRTMSMVEGGVIASPACLDSDPPCLAPSHAVRANVTLAGAEIYRSRTNSTGTFVFEVPAADYRITVQPITEEGLACPESTTIAVPPDSRLPVTVECLY
jgi:hypothetical protein